MSLFIVALIVGFCGYYVFCCVHSSFAIILMGKRESVALLCLSCWCLAIVVWLFLTMPRVCLQFVNVVFPDRTRLLFFNNKLYLCMLILDIQDRHDCIWTPILTNIS